MQKQIGKRKTKKIRKKRNKLLQEKLEINYRRYQGLAKLTTLTIILNLAKIMVILPKIS